ncbi:hypothetical protein TNCV_3222761 [Trichonephila clavipes]|nr:hypothetical protein TNCV_3222761 [Trichonephila clavipes]
MKQNLVKKKWEVLKPKYMQLEFNHVAVIVPAEGKVWKGFVERVRILQSLCLRLTLNNVVDRSSSTLSVDNCRRNAAPRRHFDIPPRGHVHDRKCVLMRMDAFRATGNDSKKGKDLRRQFERLKMWNEFVLQFRLVSHGHSPPIPFISLSAPQSAGSFSTHSGELSSPDALSSQIRENRKAILVESGFIPGLS